MVEYPEIVYRLTPADELAAVNDAWDRFAHANHGAHLSAEPIVGRSLWEFVSDPTVRQIYRDLLDRVRQGRVVRYTFRCDSPDLRRLFEMHVHLDEAGAVEFRSRTIAEEAREAQRLLDADVARTEERLEMCSWCKKVRVDGDWHEVEEAVARAQLFEAEALPQVTHGICQPCFHGMRAVLEAGGHRRG